MYSKNIKSKKYFLKYSIIIISIVSLLSAVNIYNLNKQRGYYIGKIESIEHKDQITTVEVLPITSNRYFTREIKANHKIEYADNILISGLRDRNKESKKLYLGQLVEVVGKLKVGDTIIFKVRDYDKNNYKLEIYELGVDLTLD